MSLALAAVANTPLVIALGDSLTYGQDTKSPNARPAINGSNLPRAGSTYPDVLRYRLRKRARVYNFGYPGDRSVDGIKRWQPRKAKLAVIMYGTNDVFNFAHRSGGAVSAREYENTLVAMANEWRSKGARVLIVAPPPMRNVSDDRKLGSYRRAARRAAEYTNSGFKEFTRPKFDAWSDNVHFNENGYKWIGNELYPYASRAIN